LKSVKLWQAFEERLAISDINENNIDKIFAALDEIYCEEDAEAAQYNYEKRYYQNNFECYTKKVRSNYQAMKLIDDKELIKSICKQKIYRSEEADRFYELLTYVN
jgi:hypothetical protein